MYQAMADSQATSTATGGTLEGLGIYLLVRGQVGDGTRNLGPLYKPLDVEEQGRFHRQPNHASAGIHLKLISVMASQ